MWSSEVKLLPPIVMRARNGSEHCLLRRIRTRCVWVSWTDRFLLTFYAVCVALLVTVRVPQSHRRGITADGVLGSTHQEPLEPVDTPVQRISYS